MWTGTFPFVDEDGVLYLVGSWGYRIAHEVVQIVGGYFGVLFISQGDLDFQSDLYGRPRRNVLQPCSCCPATQPDGALPYDDFQISGGLVVWMALIYSILHFLAADPFPHPFWKILGASGYTLHLDYMHAKHLVVDKYLLGSVLFLLVYRLLPGTPDDNLAQVWIVVEDYYKRNETKTRYKILKLTMFNDGSDGYPVQ